MAKGYLKALRESGLPKKLGVRAWLLLSEALRKVPDEEALRNAIRYLESGDTELFVRSLWWESPTPGSGERHPRDIVMDRLVPAMSELWSEGDDPMANVTLAIRGLTGMAMKEGLGLPIPDVTPGGIPVGKNLLTIAYEIQPKLRDRFLEAIDLMANSADMGRFVDALEAGDIEQAGIVLFEATDEEFGIDGAAPLMRAMTSALMTETADVSKRIYRDLAADLEKYIPRGGRVRSGFSPGFYPETDMITDPDLLFGRRIVDISQSTRAAVLDAISEGLADGRNPRSIALDIVGRINQRTGNREGGILGLSPDLERHQRNAYYELQSVAGMRKFLTRKLRDKRFDRSILKAIRDGEDLPFDLRMKILAAYNTRLLRYRGERVARTETLFVIHKAQDEALRKMVERGKLKRSWIKRYWIATLDDRVRDTHEIMNGAEEASDGYFDMLDPVTGMTTGLRLKYPGDMDAPPEEVINCRCWVQPKIDLIARFMEQEGLAPESPDDPYRVEPSLQDSMSAPIGPVEAPYGNPETIELSDANGRLMTNLTERDRQALKMGLNAILQPNLTELRIRADYRDALSILAEGEFYNQHFIGDSNGLYSPTIRTTLEEALFDLDSLYDGLPIGDSGRYPVYGYLAAEYTVDSRDHIVDRAGQYGDIVFRISEDLRPRTTISFGDTLNHNGHTLARNNDRANARLVPSPLNDPMPYSVNAAASDDYIDHLIAVGNGVEPVDLFFLKGGQAQVEYVEAQYHGGLSMQDVEEVWLPSVDGNMSAVDAYQMLEQVWDYHNTPVRFSYLEKVDSLFEWDTDQLTSFEGVLDELETTYAKLKRLRLPDTDSTVEFVVEMIALVEQRVTELRHAEFDDLQLDLNL